MTTSNNHEETRQEDIFARPEIAELLKKAKQKNNLSAEEISEMLLNLETDLEPEQIEKLYDKLESFGVGFKLGNEDKAEAVTKTLQEMYADGTVAKIIAKYEDQAVSMDNWLLK